MIKIDDHGALAKMEQTHQSYTSIYNGFMIYIYSF